MIQIEVVKDERGTVPFEKWFQSLKDKKTRQHILARLERVKLGNFGDWKSIARGVNEMRIYVGPGYRVYFGRRGAEIVLLLGGGSKSSQERDIKKAVELWNWYESEE